MGWVSPGRGALIWKFDLTFGFDILKPPCKPLHLFCGFEGIKLLDLSTFLRIWGPSGAHWVIFSNFRVKCLIQVHFIYLVALAAHRVGHITARNRLTTTVNWGTISMQDRDCIVTPIFILLKCWTMFMNIFIQVTAVPWIPSSYSCTGCPHNLPLGEKCTHRWPSDQLIDLALECNTAAIAKEAPVKIRKL